MSDVRFVSWETTEDDEELRTKEGGWLFTIDVDGEHARAYISPCDFMLDPVDEKWWVQVGQLWQAALDDFASR